MRTRHLFLSVLAWVLAVSGSAQNLATAGLDKPVSADDVTVTSGVLRTIVMCDSIVMNQQTGKMDTISAEVEYVDVDVTQSAPSIEATVERVRRARRAQAPHRVRASEQHELHILCNTFCVMQINSCQRPFREADYTKSGIITRRNFKIIPELVYYSKYLCIFVPVKV